MSCIGPAVTQSHINQLLFFLQLTNIGKDLGVPIKLTISQTNLTDIDLTSFTSLSFQNLIIAQNPSLQSFSTYSSSLINATNLDLSHNSITDSGLGSILLNFTHRVNHVDLQGNLLTSLSKDNFHPFFFNGNGNDGAREVTMDLRGNTFMCDENMAWLKELREELEPRITGLDCANDSGFTVFTSAKISDGTCKAGII